MDLPEIIVLRHGETVWNRENRMQGSMDSPLTVKGQTQAKHQGVLLGTFDLSGWTAHCSPQGRARETAALALFNFDGALVFDDRLREIEVGEWTGDLKSNFALPEAVLKNLANPIEAYRHAPGGEGFASLENRCRSFLETLKGPSVIVTHGVTSRMLRVLALNLPLSQIGEIAGGQGNLFHVKDGMQKEIV